MRGWIPVLGLSLCGCGAHSWYSSRPPLGIPNPRTDEPRTQVDLLTPSTLPVDVLWVVDNSAGMYEQQVAMADQVDRILDPLREAQLDFHIGVVTTDMDDTVHQGRLVEVGGARWLDPTTPSPSYDLAVRFQLGTGGSNDERGLDAVASALDVHGVPGGANEGFEREDAALHVIVLSDESDYSTDVTVDDLVDRLLTRKPDGQPVRFSSLVWFGLVDCWMSTPGDAYLEVTEAVGGVAWDLCDRDWPDVADLLAADTLSAAIGREFLLTRLPVPGSLVVSIVEGELRYPLEPEVEWTYDPARNAVTLLEPLVDPQVVVEFVYEVSSDGA